MKRHFITGSLLALILATSCTPTHEKKVPESFPPPLMGWSS